MSLIITTVPFITTGFNITGEYHQGMTTTIVFEWDLPQGSGPAAIVDYYIISISPKPPSHPSTNAVSQSPWNVSLVHNTEYSVNITSVNCAGQGHTFTFTEIDYSKAEF